MSHRPASSFFPDLKVGAYQSTHHGLRCLRVSAKRAPISGNEHGSYPPDVPRSSGAGHRAELDGLTESSLRQLVPERDWSCRRKEQIGGSFRNRSQTQGLFGHRVRLVLLSAPRIPLHTTAVKRPSSTPARCGWDRAIGRGGRRTGSSSGIRRLPP
jgi:hypothetical protein